MTVQRLSGTEGVEGGNGPGYRVTKAFPEDELFGMTSQIRRSAASIPANFAEGQGREHTKEFLSHVSIARGSLKELGTHLLPCQRVG